MASKKRSPQTDPPKMAQKGPKKAPIWSQKWYPTLEWGKLRLNGSLLPGASRPKQHPHVSTDEKLLKILQFLNFLLFPLFPSYPLPSITFLVFFLKTYICGLGNLPPPQNLAQNPKKPSRLWGRGIKFAKKGPFLAIFGPKVAEAAWWGPRGFWSCACASGYMVQGSLRGVSLASPQKQFGPTAKVPSEIDHFLTIFAITTE